MRNCLAIPILLVASEIAPAQDADGQRATESPPKITDQLRLYWGPDGAPALFSQLDQNGDGLLDRNEAAFDLALRRQFASVDQDSDALVDLTEYSGFHRAEIRRAKQGRE